jgi:thymidylate kinase
VLIVLEGPDRAGKSTLVRDLLTTVGRQLGSDVARGATLLHRGPPQRHPLDEYEADLWSYRPGTGQHVICDRWHLGEVVYPAALHRRTAFTPASMLHVELLLLARGALPIHVTNTVDVLRRRLLAEASAKPWQHETLDDVTQRFGRAAYDSWLSWITIVPDHQDQQQLKDRVVEQAVALACQAEQRAAPLTKFVSYVGPTNPDVLILGDVRGPRNQNPNAPAFVPYGGTSGTYLLEALIGAVGDGTSNDDPDDVETSFATLRDLRHVGIANACDRDDVMALWCTLGEPRVVALGRHAAQQLARLKLPATVLPHPQYVRRFWHHRLGEYGRQILGMQPAEPIETWTQVRPLAVP